MPVDTTNPITWLEFFSENWTSIALLIGLVSVLVKEIIAVRDQSTDIVSAVDAVSRANEQLADRIFKSMVILDEERTRMFTSTMQNMTQALRESVPQETVLGRLAAAVDEFADSVDGTYDGVDQAPLFEELMKVNGLEDDESKKEIIDKTEGQG